MSKEREPLREQWDENLLRQIIKRIDVNDCIGNHDVVAEVVKSYLLTKLSNQTTTNNFPSDEKIMEEALSHARYGVEHKRDIELQINIANFIKTEIYG